MKASMKFSPEVQERAVRMVAEAQGQHDSQWAAIVSIARRRSAARPRRCAAGCVRRSRDRGQREGQTTVEAQRIRELEREVRELRKANEILKLASAFFARAELDRRCKS